MSDFVERVHAAVKAIPEGEIRTYKDIADAVGAPRAWRAVGSLMAKNRDVSIPCHRVIRSDLHVGRYNRGDKKKVAILEKEGVTIVNGKVVF